MLNFGYDNLIETPEQSENSFCTTWSEELKSIFRISSSIDRRHCEPVENVNSRHHRDSTIITNVEYETLFFFLALMKLLLLLLFEWLMKFYFIFVYINIYSTHLLLRIYNYTHNECYLWSSHYLICVHFWYFIAAQRSANSFSQESNKKFPSSYHIIFRMVGRTWCDWWWIYTKFFTCLIRNSWFLL